MSKMSVLQFFKDNGLSWAAARILVSQSACNLVQPLAKKTGERALEPYASSGQPTFLGFTKVDLKSLVHSPAHLFIEVSSWQYDNATVFVRLRQA